MEAASPTHPKWWRLERGGLVVMVTESTLLLPDDPVLSSLVDVWRRREGVLYELVARAAMRSRRGLSRAVQGLG